MFDYSVIMAETSTLRKQIGGTGTVLQALHLGTCVTKLGAQALCTKKAEDYSSALCC